MEKKYENSINAYNILTIEIRHALAFGLLMRAQVLKIFF